MFFDYITKIIPLSDKDKEILSNLIVHKKLRKRQYFLQEGNVSYHSAWVIKGCLRTYSVNENGLEQTMQIAVEGWWSTDMYSFLTGEPSIYNIEAIEDTEILVLDKIGREKIFESIPAFERLMRLLIEKNMVANQQRMNDFMSKNAEERYLKFTKSYPHILQRVPLHIIASYLGITPETLSRIRKQLSE